MKFVLAVLLALTTTVASATQNVVIVFDNSGSMNAVMQGGKSRLQTAKDALTKVIAGLSEDTNLGLLILNPTYDGKIIMSDGYGWPIVLSTLDKNNAIMCVNRILPGGGTPLGGSMKAGTDALLAKRAKESYGTYRLLVVTDGEAGDPQLLEKFLPDILARGVSVDVIGLDMRQDHSLATKVNNYRRGNDAEEIVSALKKTFAETSFDDASSQDDFLLLNAIPDGMETKILKTLAETGNHPIGTSAKIVDESGVEQPAPAAKVTDSNTPVQGQPAEAGLIVFVEALLWFMVGLVVVVGLIKLMT